MSGLQREDADSEAGKSYAMLVADTVVVKPGGAPPDVATALAPRDWKDVAYYLKVQQLGCGSWGGSLQSCTCIPRVISSWSAAPGPRQQAARCCKPCACSPPRPAAQDGGEEEEEGEEEAAVVEVPEAGMRKSARTEHVDFKQREEER